MADEFYEDPYLASLYDRLARDRGDERFYLDLMHSAPAVLDAGCGTGSLLARARSEGHGGRLVGLDPARPMLDVARRRAGDVEWVPGMVIDAASWPETFDLVYMTGHAFQVLLTDEDVIAALGAIRIALAAGGSFAFETRNPRARPWERWTPDRVTEVEDEHGVPVRTWHEVLDVTGEYVRFTESFAADGWPAPRVSTSTLRFMPAGHLDHVLTAAGLRVDERYGFWDRRPFCADSLEIITVASAA